MNLKKVLSSDYDLYSIVFDDYCTFEFRLLKIKEFNLFNKLLNNNVSPLIIYDEIFNVCFLGKAEYLPSDLPAGYSISTGQMIYEMSGNTSGEDFLLNIAKARELNPLDSIYEHMRCVIFLGFNTITPAQIDEMTEKQFIKNFVSAENLLTKTKEGFQRLDLEKIYKEMYNINDAEEKPKHQYINDASMLEKELGYWEVKEAENALMKEQMQMINKEKLSRSDLRSLDRR